LGYVTSGVESNKKKNKRTEIECLMDFIQGGDGYLENKIKNEFA